MLIGKRTAFAVLLIVLAGCASLPVAVDRPASSTLVAPSSAPLAAVAREAAIAPGLSGFRPLPQAAFALDTRLELIRHAQVSLDLQCYLIGDDSTGRLILREVRDAASRGVRVRLLLDDLYTEEMDDMLLGLAAHANVEVRLFNPLPARRGSLFTRLLFSLHDFGRINHRMHNKLFVADGVMAVAGGRNLADEYFMRSKEANFIDFDLLMTGAVVPQLSTLFDAYWNSDKAFPLQAVTRNDLSAAERRDAFSQMVRLDVAPAPEALTGADSYGRPPFGNELAARRYNLIVARAGAVADQPGKLLAAAGRAPETVTDRYQKLLREVRSELTLVSPYFIPGKVGVERLREMRDRGVAVRVITNATSASDEPLVNMATARYRRELLRMGVRLFEVDSSRLMRDAAIRGLFRSSTGRLHAKVALIDRELVLLGSMNVDPRSAFLNTEIGIAVRSPELAQQVLPSHDLETVPGVYELQLRPDGRRIEWVGRDEAGEERLDAAPGVSWLQGMRLFLMSLFIAEDLL